MPTVYPSAFGPTFQWENTAGEPAVGDKVFFYLAGSNTKVNTYTDSTGVSLNTNPVVLNALGMPPNEVWWPSGMLYKVVWAPSTDTDPPSSPIRTWDNLSGIGDVSLLAASEWTLYTAAATYISATSFSVTGDQTSIFQIGRRLQTTNAGGTVYSTITNSVFGAVTTVTVTNDSGVLDSGLSAVYYGILSVTNSSVPATIARLASPTFTGDPKAPTPTVGDNDTSIATTAFVTTAVAAVTVPQIITAPVPTFNAGAMTIPGVALSLDFRSTTLGSGTITRVIGTPSSLVISSGSTLGTINAIQSDIIVVAINNAGTIEYAAINISGGNDLSETGVISTTAEGGAGGADSANVFYSTTARTNVAYRVIGIIRSTQATAGTWATAPSLIQGAGGNALTAMSSLGYGQTWQDLTGSRALSTTYYNTTGKPIGVSCYPTGAVAQIITVNGLALTQTQVAGIGFCIIPPGASYSITGGTLSKWFELR